MAAGGHSGRATRIPTHEAPSHLLSLQSAACTFPPHRGLHNPIEEPHMSPPPLGSASTPGRFQAAPKGPGRKRGKRAGIQARLKDRGLRPPLPTLFLANVQSLENYIEEFKAQLLSQRQLRQISVICCTETWLTPNTPDAAIRPEGFTIYRLDRNYNSAHERGGGVCFFVNSGWCTDARVMSTSCSPDLEQLSIKCRPFYLPREFPLLIITGVYIPPDADHKQALAKLCDIVDEQETARPNALQILVGNFNQACLKKTLPNYHQHVTCCTGGSTTLSHCYTTIKNVYRSFLRSHFGKSDHLAVLLLPAYKQRVKTEAAEMRTTRMWSWEAEEQLHDCPESVDWDVFKNSAEDLNDYTSVVTDFNKTVVDECVPTKSFTVFPNQKPWMNSEIWNLLRARSQAFKTGDKEYYKRCRSDLRKAIAKAKWRFRTQMESRRDAQKMWQNLNAITCSQATSCDMWDSRASLPDELNAFSA